MGSGRKTTYKDTYKNIRADQLAELNYRCKGSMPDVPILAIAEENDGSMVDDMRGWRAATKGNFAMQIMRSGGHLFPCEEALLGGIPFDTSMKHLANES